MPVKYADRPLIRERLEDGPFCLFPLHCVLLGEVWRVLVYSSGAVSLLYSFGFYKHKPPWLLELGVLGACTSSLRPKSWGASFEVQTLQSLESRQGLQMVS